MYNTKSIETFIIERKVVPVTIKVTRLRMAEIADKYGNLPANQLDWVLGSHQLAEECRQACPRTLRSMLFPEEKNPYYEIPIPHHSRVGLGSYQAPMQTFI